MSNLYEAEVIVLIFNILIRNVQRLQNAQEWKCVGN